MRIVLVEPGKPARCAEIKGGLASMQEVVGGYIQALYPWDDPVAVICNDEGKLNRLPLNRMLGNYDIIAGTFFVCGIQGEDFASLNDQQLRKYQQMFRYPEKFIPTSRGLLCIKIRPLIDPEEKSKRPPEHQR